MTELIDGWECVATKCTQGRPLRIAKRYGTSSVWYIQLQSDGVLTGSGAGIGIPPRVLVWLIKPHLRSAYAQGWADRNGQLDGAEMPRIYEDT